MSQFMIRLLDEPFESEGEAALVGSLTIGDFSEQLHCSLSYWTRERYEAQWKEALSRLVNGESSSALVTSMHDPRFANFIRWWVMYRDLEIVQIQEHILFLRELDTPLDESDLYASVPDRETETEDGERVSEWVLPVSAIHRCLEELMKLD